MFEEALFYIRTFCLSQILFERNMSFALILLFLGGKTLMQRIAAARRERLRTVWDLLTLCLHYAPCSLMLEMLKLMSDETFDPSLLSVLLHFSP